MNTISAGIGLALGTAQFGLPYGIAGRGAVVPENEVREILETAHGGGIAVLDTAPVYGDIEGRLQDLCGELGFEIISKIAPAPPTGAAHCVRGSVTASRERLGERLSTLLFHRSEDLLRPDGDALWRAAVDEAGPVRVGVSAYDPTTILELHKRFGITVAQLPANPMDQRLRAPGLAATIKEIELHARSVFLQGLLLMDSLDAAGRVPASIECHARWTDWCRVQQTSPLSAALAITRSLPGIRLCVVGVDCQRQLGEILEAVGDSPACEAPDLACDDPDVIDPRRWTAA